MFKRNALFIVALVLVLGGAGLLLRLRATQHLGKPGVVTAPTEDPRRLKVILPTSVPGFDAEPRENDEIELSTLPADTSFGKMIYQAQDGSGFQCLASVVLMGTDRTSLHKPQYCLEGQGWHIDNAASADVVIPMQKPFPYELHAVKLISTKTINDNGVPARGVYVYWYAADNALSAGTLGYQRMWLMARELAKTGILQRWSYITFFSACPIGQEDATFEKIKTLIARTVPEFQIPPGTDAGSVTKVAVRN